MHYVSGATSNFPSIILLIVNRRLLVDTNGMAALAILRKRENTACA